MRSILRRLAAVALALLCVLSLSACDSFYALFEEDGGGEDGVYFAIFDERSTEEEIAAIPAVPLMAGDLRDEIREKGLSFEVTIAFDLETDADASLSCYYYHNRENPDAADYCCIGKSFLGTYAMDGDTITFQLDPEGFNLAVYHVGVDYAGLEQFQRLSYAEDGGDGEWAYANATYDHADAAIDARILENVPEVIELTVSGNRITSWGTAG